MVVVDISVVEADILLTIIMENIVAAVVAVQIMEEAVVAAAAVHKIRHRGMK